VRTSIVCAICGEPHNGEEGWFLLTENRWTDRVKVLAFNPLLAGEEGIFCVCGRAHVRELVVHWMVTGRLDYPFAEFPSPRPVRTRSERRQPAARVEPNVGTSAVIGELAVDRESLMRVLGESPESLSAILEALVAGLNAATAPIRCSCCAEGQEGADNTELALTQA
jgi:hypothetical protein